MATTTGQVLHPDPLYRALLGTLAQGVVVHAANGEIVDCNPAAERILGLSRDQMAGRTSVDPRWQAVHEDGSPFPGELHPAMVTLRTGRALHDVLMGVVTPAGERRWITIDSIPVPGGPDAPPDAPPDAVITTFTEVTELRRGREALIESETRYRWLADHVSDVIWTMDPDTLRLTYVSPSIVRLRGITPDQAMREPMDEALLPESLERARAYIAWFAERRDTQLRGQEPQITDVFAQPCADGSVRQVEMTLSGVVGDDGRIATILGVSRDVTARIEAERERERTVAELREALARVRTLSGLLPICMYCKKIRTDEGYWDRIETYLAQHTDALFSHSLCPDCYAAHIPADLQEDREP